MSASEKVDSGAGGRDEYLRPVDRARLERWDKQRLDREGLRAIARAAAEIADGLNEAVEPGEPGELTMADIQGTLGRLQDAVNTLARCIAELARDAEVEEDRDELTVEDGVSVVNLGPTAAALRGL